MVGLRPRVLLTPHLGDNEDKLCCLIVRMIIQLAVADTLTGKVMYITLYIYRVSREERAKLREGVPYVKLYRYNPKHLYPKLNGYGDNGKRSLKL